MTEPTQPSRPAPNVIYERVKEDALDELERPARSLAFSALFAGFTIGATPLAVAATLTVVNGDGRELIAALLYPIGFIAVILGRGQFFTENTLYPVVASLDDRRCIPATARLWAIVLGVNLVGVFAFALLFVESGALGDDVVGELVRLGDEAAAGTFGHVFWSGVLAGWVLALVAWLVEAAETAVGQILTIWALTLLVGLAALDHSVATAIDVAVATIGGDVHVGDMFEWLAAATLGNIVGGVLIVSALNYGQVKQEEPAAS